MSNQILKAWLKREDHETLNDMDLGSPQRLGGGDKYQMLGDTNQ